MPTSAMIPVSVAVEKREIHPSPPPNSERQITQPVILVPSMAPSTIGIARRNFIIPELTKPTAITEVADDDWIIAVTPVPSSSPFKDVLVSFASSNSNLPPAVRFNPSPISDIPNKNSAIPQRRENIFEIFILSHSHRIQLFCLLSFMIVS